MLTPLSPDRLSETLVRVTRAIIVLDYRRNPQAWEDPPSRLTFLANTLQLYGSSVIPAWLIGLRYDVLAGYTVNEAIRVRFYRCTAGYDWRSVCYTAYKFGRRSRKGGFRV